MKLLFLCLLALSVGIAKAQRPVIIEEFTGTWCGPCYSAGVALDRISRNYPRSQVIVLAFHYSDNYTSPYESTRRAYYSVPGFPTVWFNGFTSHVGGSTVSSGETGISSTYNTYVSKIQSEQTRTAASAPFRLALRGSIGPSSPDLTLEVSTTTGYPQSVTAHFFITEDNINPVSGGTNGQTELNSVVRSYLGSRAISLPSPNTSTQVRLSGPAYPYISASQLQPAVFLQSSSKEVLGAAGYITQASVAADWALYP